MNKSWFYLGAIGSLSILTTSCGGDSQPPAPAASPAVTAPAPAAAVPPVAPATPLATAPNSLTGSTPPADPAKSTAAIKPVSVDVAAGLIAPTDGESWAKTVAKGRPDPFGMLSLQPVEVIEPIDPLIQPVTSKVATKNTVLAAKSTLTKLAPLPIVKAVKIATSPKIASNVITLPTPNIRKDASVRISAIPRSGINRTLPKIIVALPPSKLIKAPAIIKVQPKIVASKIFVKPQIIAAKTEKPAEKPLQAMAIEISGVIEVAGTTQVIIKLPTESFSRYIEVGERFGNGRVLVKRVEGQNGLSPTVVLEEVGVEVPRRIGDKAESIRPESQPQP